jgi:hypothetical protein
MEIKNPNKQVWKSQSLAQNLTGKVIRIVFCGS